MDIATKRRRHAIKAMSKYTNYPTIALATIAITVVTLEFTIAGLLVYGVIRLFT